MILRTLNRVHKIEDLIYKIQKKQKHYCLNCIEPFFFEKTSIICKKCSWRNNLSNTPVSDISPIIIKTKTFDDSSSQIAYPLIEKSDLKSLPERLQSSVLRFFEKLSDFSKKDLT